MLRFQRALKTGRASIAWAAAFELEQIGLEALVLVLLIVDVSAGERAGWGACAWRSRRSRCARRSSWSLRWRACLIALRRSRWRAAAPSSAYGVASGSASAG